MARIVFLLVLSVSFFAKAQFCPDYKFQQSEYSFKKFNPAAEAVANIQFPGNNKVLYRGAYASNPQFSLESVLGALFYQKDWYMGSPVFFGITQVLTGKWTLDSTFFPSGNLPHKMRDYFEARKILSAIESLQSCNQNKPYPQSYAEILAADLMNKFFSRMNDNEIEDLYFNIEAPYYYHQTLQKLGFGNNAADLIISTSYDMIASLYGNKIVVMQDKRGRGLDLSFYNYKKNNLYFHAWVDNGEINVPGYVNAEEIIGFQQRLNDRARTNWATALPDNPITIAYYRYTLGNETAVLVLDPQDNQCITEGPDQKYYACHTYWANLMKAPVAYPAPNLKLQIPLVGVITQCASPDNCPLVEKIQAAYGKISKSPLAASEIKRIESVIVNGKKLSYHPVVQPPPPPPPPPKPAPPAPTPAPSPADGDAAEKPRAPTAKIRVAAASVRTASGVQNIKAVAAKFLDGSESKLYKVSAAYLSLNESEDYSFSLQWRCVSSTGFSQLRRKDIASPAEGKKFVVSCRDIPY